MFSFANGDSVSSNINTVTDFVTGVDRISVGQANTKFIGNFSDVDTALAAMTAGDQSFFVTTSNQLYVVATAGTLHADDEVIKLTGVTELTSADVGLGSLGPGNDITLTNGSAVVTTSTNTNATAKSTNLDDNFYSLSTYLVGSSLDGALGTNTLIMSDAITGGFALGASIGGGQAKVINTQTLNLYASSANSVIIADGTDVEFNRITLGDKGDTIDYEVAAANNGGTVTITGGAKGDTIEFSGAAPGKASVDGGAGNDTIAFAVATTAAHTLDGGTGDANVLNVTGAITVSFAASNISNIQQLTASDTDASDITITNSQFTGLDTIDLGTGTDTLNLSGSATYDFTGIAYTNSATTKLAALSASSTIIVDAADIGTSIDDFVVGTAGATGGTLKINDSTAVNLTGSSNGGAVKNVAALQFQNAEVTLALPNIWDGTSDTDEGFRTITGSNGASSKITVAGGAGSVSFLDANVTGVKTFNIVQAGGTNTSLSFNVADLANATSVVTNDGSGTSQTDLNLVIQDSGDISAVVFSNVDNTFDSVAFNVGDLASSTLTVNDSLVSVLTAGGFAIDGNGGATTANDGAVVIDTRTSSTGFTVAAATLTDVSSFTINDADTGSQTYTVATADASRALMTVNLVSGNDVVALTNAAMTTVLGDSAVTITGFTAGSGVGFSKLAVTNATAAVSEFHSIASNAAADISGTGFDTLTAVIEITGTGVTDFTDYTAVGTVINTAVGISVDNESQTIVIYGAGDLAGQAAVYTVLFAGTSGAVDGIDMVAILGNGIVADSLAAANFV